MQPDGVYIYRYRDNTPHLAASFMEIYTFFLIFWLFLTIRIYFGMIAYLRGIFLVFLYSHVPQVGNVVW